MKTVTTTPNADAPPESERTTPDEQIEILAQTVANVSAALNRVKDEALADRIRSEQEDVADTRRRAQANEDLLRLRVQ